MILGWVVVTVFAVVAVAVVVTTPHRAVSPREGPPDSDAAASFIDAWERSRQATFVRSGTFERRSESTGAAITSEDVLAQRPPRRLHRQLGGIEGRDDQRSLSCPAPPTGASPVPCTLGPPTGPTYDEDVAAEIEGLHSLLDGDAPVYGVSRAGDDCYTLVQRRVEPRAPFGVEARFCFDASTGAPTDSRVHYAGGVTEVIAVAELSGTVEDADLEP
jgi:hypothetical protein